MLQGKNAELELPAQAIDLSFVIPLFNEEDVFEELIERVSSTLSTTVLLWEVVLVDDGSRDSTPQKILQLCRRDARFRGILLSRNFGHQSAVSAGLDHARGNCIGILDADLQDPPEILLDFYQKTQEGYDVVYAVRQRRKEGPIKRFCYWSFYRLLRYVANIDVPLDSGDFCMMTSQVAQHMRAMPEHHRFLRGMRSWVGFRQIGVSYNRDERAAGTSKYGLRKLLQLALDGIFTFSEAPLRFATLSGVVVAMLAFCWTAYVLFWRIFGDTAELPGFATIACAILFLGGIQLICLGILGEYVARIHNEVKRRPLYIVARDSVSLSRSQQKIDSQENT